MFRLPDDMFHEIERFHQSLKKALTTGEKVISQVQKSLPNWFRGPKTEVYDEGYKVRIVVEAPGLSKNSGLKWAVRMVEGHLVLRGVLSVEQTLTSDNGKYYSERKNEVFTKLIPMPAPVKRKPMSVTYERGLLVLDFVKTTSGRIDDRWFEFTID